MKGAAGFALALLALAALATAAPARAAAPPSAPAGTYLCAGGEAAWLFDRGRGARSIVAEALFQPGTVGQFSRTLAEQRLGLTLRYHRGIVRELLHLQGAEICLRRGLGEAGRPWQPFVELGVGQVQVDFERGGSDRSTWNAVLSAGTERTLGARWLLEGAVQVRSIEYAGESLTHAAFLITIGGRIDA